MERQVCLTLHDLEGVQVCRFSFVDAEDLLSVPHNTVQIARQHSSGVTLGENLNRKRSELINVIKSFNTGIVSSICP